MTNEEFKKQYEGIFTPDVVITEIIEFLQGATNAEIQHAKRMRVFPKDAFRQAQQILYR